MKSFRNQLSHSINALHREQKGAEAVEWIALVAVLLLLLLAVSAVTGPQGAAIGQQVTENVSCWVGKWAGDSCNASGPVVLANPQPSAGNPLSGAPTIGGDPTANDAPSEETSGATEETRTDEQIADELNDAMDGWGTDEDAIRAIVNGLTDAQKQAVLNNKALMDRLYSELGRGDMVEILAALGADPAVQLNEAMNGWGTDEDAIRDIVAGLTEAEKQAVLNNKALMDRLASELSRDDMLEVLAALNANPADQLREAMDGRGRDRDAMLEIIANASDTEREAIWSDSKLKEQIRDELGDDGYLDFITEAEMVRPGTAGHMSAAEADTLIQGHLSAYLGDALKDGRQISGRVAVVDDDDWDVAGIAHYGEKRWKDTKRDGLNGFVDSEGRVWVHKDRGTGTMMHEAVHKYSDDAMIGVSQPLNEGVTEYFTRSVFDSTGSPPARSNYQNNFRFTEDLVNLVGEDVVAEAYFDGDMDGLKEAYIDAGKTEADWDTMIEHTKKDEWSDARKLAKP